MTESFWAAATVTTAIGAASGVVAAPVLGMVGIDGASVGAGLLGCIAVQIFMPPEKIMPKAIAMTAVGSMIVASIGAPFVTPWLLKLLPNATHVTPEQANAAAAAILGGFAKPIVKLIGAMVSKSRIPGAGEGAKDA